MGFSISLLVPMLVGALLNLDKQVFGPFMVGRPLVVGFVLGLVSGELACGMWLGLSAELLWLATMPLGGQLTPNPGLAVTAAFLGWLMSDAGHMLGADQREAGLVLAFFTVPCWARIFTVIDTISRKVAVVQLNQALDRLEAGREPHLFWRNLRGLVVTLGCSLGALAVAALVTGFLLEFLMGLNYNVVLFNSFQFLFIFIPFLGLFGMAVFLDSKIMNLYVYGILAGLLALSTV